ncbi:glycosyltransferase family 4 protein [Ornithinicoccus hortensis]|uniref:D-inositol 3-phosphate glycosyltransferase n=1 Tax=Ornithinicoccus hortensis TaxID=82346 RepID=A0A542YTB3_9MICO|nr:glycosyltransferase family 4 protein [Ornithinicoccus hortensis]TQL51318.1 phosphatidylinositol alpha-mannosyltransferase [Ornithinicoccus hortensis]
MRVGLVSPYSFDVPGGVQLHVKDLATELISRGHQVSVLAPAEDDTPLPDFVVSAGSAVPVRYNGSVARLAFGPQVSARVDAWLAEGRFDVIHIHEPASPSVSLLALWAAQGPVVATFHTATLKSRAMRMANPILRPSLEKLSARIAVSEAARKTVTAHVGGTTVVIPNGVYVKDFRPDPTDQRRWGSRTDGPRVVFLGRFDEPRKGLHVLAEAVPSILRAHPDAQILVAGPGDVAERARALPDDVAKAMRFLGALSHEDKVSLLAGADVYVAPNTGGESFGIILVEAMAAGAPVVASDLDAFTAVLDHGRAGLTFPVGDGAALASQVCSLLDDPERRRRVAEAGTARAWAFDWSRVGEQVLAVYESVRPADLATVELERSARPWSGWWRR